MVMMSFRGEMENPVQEEILNFMDDAINLDVLYSFRLLEVVLDLLKFRYI
jgi:hypothetical protein